jgi:phosphatidylethanolamine/phosphatidyl-N-methylethanolamine N-methyltransferase
MQLPEIKKVYARYARVYDAIFERWFSPRTRHVIQALNLRPGQRILDVGVGTGLALPLYPKHTQVVGIDLSGAMLREAREKVRQQHLDHVTLLEMDACRLAVRDDSFDVVLAAFVITVVPDPVQMVAEMKRVCKPQGRLVLLNHFQSENRCIARLEAWLSPLWEKLGWRSELALSALAQHADLQIERRYAFRKLDLWKIVLARNNK